MNARAATQWRPSGDPVASGEAATEKFPGGYRFPSPYGTMPLAVRVAVPVLSQQQMEIIV